MDKHFTKEGAIDQYSFYKYVYSCPGENHDQELNWLYDKVLTVQNKIIITIDSLA